MIVQRKVKDYEQYIHEQGMKARSSAAKFINTKEKRVREFIPVFQNLKPFMNPGPVLCLGARTGCEVVAAQKVGFAGSVGIDLHPLDKSVQQADWHYMPFVDDVFPNIFTNCLDHCADLTRLANEIKRVLTKDGIFVFSATDRSNMKYEDWKKKPNSEYLFWANPDDIRDALKDLGFIPKVRLVFGRSVLYAMGAK